jgi:hypothetical protein
LKDIAQKYTVVFGEDVTLNILADAIVSNVVDGGKDTEALVRLASYYPQKAKFDVLTKEQLCNILKIDPTKKTTKPQILEDMRDKIQSGDIRIDELSEHLISGVLLSIKKPDVSQYLAKKLGWPGDAITNEDLVKLVLGKIRDGSLNEKNIDAYLAEAEMVFKTKKTKDEAIDLKVINAKLEGLKHEIDLIKPKIEELYLAQQKSGFKKQYRQDIEKDLETFLKRIKDIEHATNDRTIRRYDLIIEELTKEYETPQLVEKALIAVLLSSLSELIKTQPFPTSIDDFKQALREETEKLKFVSRPVICQVREKIMERLSINAAEFNKFMLDCQHNGTVTLIEGSPASQKDGDWIDHGGRRYYYFSIERGK